MIALCIIAGIILLFSLILSIRAHIHVQYEDELTAYASWAFLKIPLFPRPEKPPKEKKKKEETPAEEKKEEQPKEPKAKGPNPLKVLYDNEKISGILEILKKLLEVIDKFGRRTVRAFVIDEMFLDISVSRNDAAETAVEYGKMCQKVFPVTGAVCANCNVKKYCINIDPDYIGKGYNEYAFSMEISLNPRKLINAVLLFAFGAVFKVGIRLLKGISPKAQPENGDKKTDNTENTEKAENTVADADPMMIGKQTVYGKYEEGSVKVPEIYDPDNILNNDNNESGAK